MAASSSFPGTDAAFEGKRDELLEDVRSSVEGLLSDATPETTWSFELLPNTEAFAKAAVAGDGDDDSYDCTPNNFWKVMKRALKLVVKQIEDMGDWQLVLLKTFCSKRVIAFELSRDEPSGSDDDWFTPRVFADKLVLIWPKEGALGPLVGAGKRDDDSIADMLFDFSQRPENAFKGAWATGEEKRKDILKSLKKETRTGKWAFDFPEDPAATYRRTKTLLDRSDLDADDWHKELFGSVATAVSDIELLVDSPGVRVAFRELVPERASDERRVLRVVFTDADAGADCECAFNDGGDGALRISLPIKTAFDDDAGYYSLPIEDAFRATTQGAKAMEKVDADDAADIDKMLAGLSSGSGSDSDDLDKLLAGLSSGSDDDDSDSDSDSSGGGGGGSSAAASSSRAQKPCPVCKRSPQPGMQACKVCRGVPGKCKTTNNCHGRGYVKAKCSRCMGRAYV